MLESRIEQSSIGSFCPREHRCWELVSQIMLTSSGILVSIHNMYVILCPSLDPLVGGVTSYMFLCPFHKSSPYIMFHIKHDNGVGHVCEPVNHLKQTTSVKIVGSD